MRIFHVVPVVLMLLQAPLPGMAQERIVNKQDADRIFGFTKAQWNAHAQQIGVPVGWTGRLSPHDTGTGLMAYDPRTGVGLGVQPLYLDDHSSPHMLIIGNYYPEGTFRDFPESLRLDMERAARADLGPAYNVSISFQRFSPFGTAFDVVEIMILPAKR